MMELRGKLWLGSLMLTSMIIACQGMSSCGNGAESDFDVWRDHCYYFANDGYIYATYAQAKKACEDMGATLVSIHSEEENEYIYNKMNTGTIWSFWIGLIKDSVDKPELKDNYFWMDGSERVYDNWAPGEPNGGLGVEDCVEYYAIQWYPARQWNDVPCQYYSKDGYVCKVKAVEGWVTYSGSEYFISYKSEDTQLNWYDARQWCMNNGADLVSLTSPAEASQVATWANSNAFKGGLWVGANRLQGDRKSWSWSDGSSWSFTNWESGYPDDDNYGQHCAFQQSSNTEGKWRNGHCDEANKGFICKRPPASGGEPTPKTDPVTPKVSGHCPAGFIGSGNKCFMVKAVDHDEGLSFSDAVNFCRQQDGYQPDLASITSPLDQAFITSQLQTITFGVWIGLHRTSSNDAWLWVDNGPQNYENWAPNEPSGYDDHCAEAWVVPGPIGTWNNLKCSSKRGYVCQTYKNPDRPINTPPPTTPHTCPHPFTPYWDGCYLYIETMQTWSAAQQECRGKDTNANLVGIHHEAENAAVSTILLNNNLNHIWTGFVDQDKSGEYKWMDGWVTFYTNWAEGQPRRENDEAGCVRMSTDGTWSDAVCSLQLPSVCKISQIGVKTTPAVRPGRCPQKTGWEEYHEHCYFFAPFGYVDWDGAKKECQKLGFGATLASIHNDLENTYIYDTLHKKGGGRSSAWIGMYRSKQDKSLRWSDLSSIQYEAWAPGEPNGEARDENCVEMYNQYWPSRWNDHYCNDMKGYVCKAPKTPEVTLPTRESHCPGDWRYFEDACYLFLPDMTVPFNMARERCQTEGGETADLASVHGWEENLYIREHMHFDTELPIHGNFFIGMSKIKAGEPYLWTDSSEVDFEHWAPTKPNDEDGDDENCVEADINTGRWDDVNCNQVRGVVCKISIADKGLSGGAIAGIVIGTLIGVVLLLAIIAAVLVHQHVIDNPLDKLKTGGLTV